MARYPVDQRIVYRGHIPFGQPDSAARFGLHAGDDSANATGTPVYAPVTGTVTPYKWGQYHGNTVEIFDGKHYPHVFHLKSVVVSPGQRVQEGDLIAYSGATGKGITGPHIHFGVGTKTLTNITSFADFIDPLAYIAQKGGEMSNNDLGKLADVRLTAINDIREAVGLKRRTDTNSVDDILAKVRLVTGDADNLLSNVGLPSPDGAAYDAIGKGPKDFLYWYSEKVKPLIKGGSVNKQTVQDYINKNLK